MCLLFFKLNVLSVMERWYSTKFALSCTLMSLLAKIKDHYPSLCRSPIFSKKFEDTGSLFNSHLLEPTYV